MMLNSLEDILAGAAPDIGRRWLYKLRGEKSLKGMNQLVDAELLSVHESVMHILAGWFDHSLDKNLIGAFFVMMGKSTAPRVYRSPSSPSRSGWTGNPYRSI